MHAGADGDGAIHGHVDLDRRRDGCLQVRHLGHHVVHGRNHVRAWNLEHEKHDRVFQLPRGTFDWIDAGHAARQDVRHAVCHRAQVAHAHRSPGCLVIPGDDRLVVLGLENLIVVVDGPAVLRVLECALGPIGVRCGKGRAHRLKTNAVVGKLLGVQLDAHCRA